MSKCLHRTIVSGVASASVLGSLSKTDNGSIHRVSQCTENNYNKEQSNHHATDYGTWLYDYFISSPSHSAMVEDNLHFKKYMNDRRTPQSGLMTWPSLTKGLRQRIVDESENAPKIRSLIAEAQKDQSKVPAITGKIAEIVYGQGESAETRQRYVEKYGCAAYTEEAFRLIVASISTGSSTITAGIPKRGLVEIGAGNGQWAKQLSERFKVDIMAFDNMTSVPLQRQAQQAQQRLGSDKSWFFTPIHEGSETVLNNWQRVTQFDLQNRVLMIIFPDPGDMAIKTLRNYAKLVDQKGDFDAVFIYVGEGRGGANADAAFFDELECARSGWTLESTCELAPFGNKGFERLFIFRRKRVPTKP